MFWISTLRDFRAPPPHSIISQSQQKKQSRSHRHRNESMPPTRGGRRRWSSGVVLWRTCSRLRGAEQRRGCFERSNGFRKRLRRNERLEMGREEGSKEEHEVSHMTHAWRSGALQIPRFSYRAAKLFQEESLKSLGLHFAPYFNLKDLPRKSKYLHPCGETTAQFHSRTVPAMRLETPLLRRVEVMDGRCASCRPCGSRKI